MWVSSISHFVWTNVKKTSWEQNMKLSIEEQYCHQNPTLFSRNIYSAFTHRNSSPHGKWARLEPCTHWNSALSGTVISLDRAFARKLHSLEQHSSETNRKRTPLYRALHGTDLFVEKCSVRKNALYRRLLSMEECTPLEQSFSWKSVL